MYVHVSTHTSASRAGGGAGTAAPAAAAAPRSAAPAETPIGAASIAVDPDLVIIEDVDEDGDPIDMPGLMVSSFFFALHALFLTVSFSCMR